MDDRKIIVSPEMSKTIKLLRTTEATAPEHFTPSPTKRIQFGDGKVFAMNRAERRRRHIYNRDLKPVRGGHK